MFFVTVRLHTGEVRQTNEQQYQLYYSAVNYQEKVLCQCRNAALNSGKDVVHSVIVNGPHWEEADKIVERKIRLVDSYLDFVYRHEVLEKGTTNAVSTLRLDKKSPLEIMPEKKYQFANLPSNAEENTEDNSLIKGKFRRTLEDLLEDFFMTKIHKEEGKADLLTRENWFAWMCLLRGRVKNKREGFVWVLTNLETGDGEFINQDHYDQVLSMKSDTGNNVLIVKFVLNDVFAKNISVQTARTIVEFAANWDSEFIPLNP